MSDVHPPDIASAHAIAEAAIAGMSIDDMLGAGMADGPHPVQAALQAALAIRANRPSDLRFRLEMLAETLRHEEASDYALALLEAAIADLDALALPSPDMPLPLTLARAG